MLIAGLFFGFCGNLMMLSEGPHGPKGEITWAPGQGQTIGVLILLGLTLGISGVVLLVTASKRDD